MRKDARASKRPVNETLQSAKRVDANCTEFIYRSPEQQQVLASLLFTGTSPKQLLDIGKGSTKHMHRLEVQQLCSYSSIIILADQSDCSETV